MRSQDRHVSHWHYHRGQEQCPFIKHSKLRVTPTHDNSKTHTLTSQSENIKNNP